ncbi:uncharacterized protein BDZ83DRAFT_601352 [Colletotrichum acutatum]|uniref:Secreted protein n=1 Tax=Glomerella acutata TaxID=27357 RepID=A0AAD8XNE3_GLOAC|nr:uncharacterized protein BDZ83DRAFT_601352 [Colletotrichum acutatum]KAK1730497.1 hypothetical protein BDZ83DRAFT_601352 [Colletotrichum acutatum]
MGRHLLVILLPSFAGTAVGRVTAQTNTRTRVLYTLSSGYHQPGRIAFRVRVRLLPRHEKRRLAGGVLECC